MPNQIPIDPELPEDFDDCPNDERRPSTLDRWWDHPYAVTRDDGSFDVRCLNGGAWDRSTWLGNAASYDEACQLAQDKQAAWVAFRAEPVMMIDDKPMLVRMPQRPDQALTVLQLFASVEAMQAWKKETHEN